MTGPLARDLAASLRITREGRQPTDLERWGSIHTHALAVDEAVGQLVAALCAAPEMRTRLAVDALALRHVSADVLAGVETAHAEIARPELVP